jgi:ATP-dependent Lhr-like helicase
VLVEDAHGAPPSVPFWFGEAPQRTGVVSDGVSELREEISSRTLGVAPGYISAAQPEVASATAWLMEGCGVCAAGAQQMIAYIVAGRAVLGAVPSKTTIIAERFFDEGGGMQLILHAPFGGRINKAWGLALRKRFCRGFNFELQAAATDNGISISLAEQHSFPLSDVFQFLTEVTTRNLLEQASLASPIFKTRWRWAAGRSLQLLRFSKGKRVAPQIQRTRSDDLMASVFPQAAACFENIEGDIQIPEHPLVREVMQDVLQEAMDLEGLLEVLRGIHDGCIRCLAVDTPVPSQFAHELLNANPYAFLDEAGLEERRTRAVSLRSGIPASVMEHPGKLDQHAIDTVRAECWPDIRDENELHDLLMSLVAFPVSMVDGDGCVRWREWYEQLELMGRTRTLDCGGISCWVGTERIDFARSLWFGQNAGSALQEDAMKKCVQGWVQVLGPVTANAFGRMLALDPALVYRAFIAMEVQGLLMRGSFERPATDVEHDVEWCERRILQRIHKLTIGNRRKQVEPISPATFMRWLLGWQHLAPQTQLAGEEGLLEVLTQLEGFEAPAVEWERTLLPARVADYNAAWLDRLCLSGAVGWGRVSPHPAFASGDGAGPRRVIPSNAAPITFYVRDTAEWLAIALEERCVEERGLNQALTTEALRAWELLKMRGACFVEDVQRVLALTRNQTQNALWELAAAGLAAADGFDPLRAMIDPERKRAVIATHSKMRSAAGRWSLFNADIPASADPLEKARRGDAAVESAARMLLARYGVVFRDLVARESNIPKWSVLLRMFRRLEDRGEIRGGRFVSGFGGEQFALPRAVESLREARNREMQGTVTIAGADPMNLVGILLPGERVASVPGRSFEYREGTETPSRAILNELRQVAPRRKRPVAPHVPPAVIDQPARSLRLF